MSDTYMRIICKELYGTVIKALNSSLYIPALKNIDPSALACGTAIVTPAMFKHLLSILTLCLLPVN